MSPTQFHDHHGHAQKEIASNGNVGLCPPPLKVSKVSHLIKKSPSSSSSSTAASSLVVTGTAKPLQQQRHPVIIYTQSPKVIQTHPKDFMALVQKLTGFSRNEDYHHHHAPHQPKTENDAAASSEEDNKRINNDDHNESSSVIKDNKNYEGQVNCCFVPPLFDPPPASFLTDIPVFKSNSADFLCVNNQPYYNYTDSFFLHQI